MIGKIMNQEIEIYIWEEWFSIQIEDYIVDKDNFQEEIKVFFQNYLIKQNKKLEDSICNLFVWK